MDEENKKNYKQDTGHVLNGFYSNNFEKPGFIPLDSIDYYKVSRSLSDSEQDAISFFIRKKIINEGMNDFFNHKILANTEMRVFVTSLLKNLNQIEIDESEAKEMISEMTELKRRCVNEIFEALNISM